MKNNTAVVMGLLMIMPGYLNGMEAKELSSEEAKIRATFELGEVYALGECGEKNIEEAQECFQEVIEVGCDKEACVWSCLWLARMSSDKEGAQGYLEKAKSFYTIISFSTYGEVPFIGQLISFLKKGTDQSLGKGIFSDAVQKGTMRVLKFILACDLKIDLSAYVSCAILSGQKDVVGFLLERGADVDAPDEDGNTPLFHALSNGDKDIAELLLKKGAAFEVKNEGDKTVFHFASGDPCAVGIGYASPLFWAVKQGYLMFAKALVEKGADLTVQDEHKRTVAHWAAAKSNKGFLEVLFKAGASFEIKDKEGMIPLHCALGDYRDKKYKSVHEAIAKLSSTPEFLLHQGACKEIIEFLLEKGAGINARSNHGTILHTAAVLGSSSLVKFLLEKGANIEAIDDRGFTPLHSAAFNVIGSKEVVEILLEAGAHIEPLGKDDVRPLHCAVAANSKDIVRLLLLSGADFDAQCEGGETALHLAITEGKKVTKEIVELLVEVGIDLEVKDRRGRTALHLAVMEGDKEVVELLLKQGANLEAKDERGKTALHYAWSRETIRELLLKNGADKEAKDNNGKMPADMPKAKTVKRKAKKKH